MANKAVLVKCLPRTPVASLHRGGAQIVADRPDAQRWGAGHGEDGFMHDLHGTGTELKLRRTGVPSQ